MQIDFVKDKKKKKMIMFIEMVMIINVIMIILIIMKAMLNSLVIIWF